MESIEFISLPVDKLEEIIRRVVSDELAKRFGSIESRGMSQATQEEYLDTARVCEELHISTKTFRKYRQERRIPFIQRGRKIYVKRSDLDAFQNANRIEAR
jgi:excisionase family DNA binding protein